MGQVDFAYEMAADGAGLPLTVSIFADRERVRVDMRELVENAGFTARECGALADLLDGEARPLGEAILIDCPALSPAGMAALSRLDARVARSGAQLVISTSVDSLDDVFGCCNQSDPQILVNPLKAERVIALGRVLAMVGGMQLREMSDDARLTLLRLTEQVDQLAEKLDRFGDAAAASGELANGHGSVFPFDGVPLENGHAAPANGNANGNGRLARATRPPLPDPRLVRRIIQQRQARARFLDGELFADPAWDMLLDLTAARVEHVRVSVTSLCIASGVPPTTALRWISQMTEAGLLERIEDETDRRRAFIQLTDKAVDAMARYFHELGKGGAQLV